MLQQVSGLDRGAYVRGFDRRNLLMGRFAPPQGSTIVVLGAETAGALGHARRLVYPYRREGATWRQVPHPSGRNPWYDNPDHRLVVGLMLEELLCRDR
jgi:hypothetical protein